MHTRPFDAELDCKKPPQRRVQKHVQHVAEKLSTVKMIIKQRQFSNDQVIVSKINEKTASANNSQELSQ